MDPQKIWQAVLGELEVSLSRANFTTWLKSTTLESINGEVATVRVPNAFTREWLNRKYAPDIMAALGKHAPSCKKLDFKVGHPTQAAPIKPATPQASEPSVPRVMAPKNSFENYVVGNSNQLAYATAKAVTQNPAGIYNPLFLYGGVGLGKTHLMQAIAKGLEHTDKTVMYTTSEKFTNDLVSAISQNKTAAFKNRYRKVDVLLVDDIQFLAGKETTQEEFFHTFNALHGEGKQIVLSSDRPPRAIPTLEERLRSRFEWGMIADVTPPELETRMAILRTKATERGYEISNAVIEFIAKAIQQNVRELEGALIRIMAHAELTATEPTPELAEQVLGTILATRRHHQVSTAQIIEAVSRFYDVSIEELKGPGRQKGIVKPRQLLMFLLREEANLSYPKIGQELGGRDHTTVIHAVGKITGESQINEPMRHELNLIRERLYA